MSSFKVTRTVLFFTALLSLASCLTVRPKDEIKAELNLKEAFNSVRDAGNSPFKGAFDFETSVTVNEDNFNLTIRNTRWEGWNTLVEEIVYTNGNRMRFLATFLSFEVTGSLRINGKETPFTVIPAHKDFKFAGDAHYSVKDENLHLDYITVLHAMQGWPAYQFLTVKPLPNCTEKEEVCEGLRKQIQDFMIDRDFIGHRNIQITLTTLINNFLRK